MIQKRTPQIIIICFGILLCILGFFYDFIGNQGQFSIGPLQLATIIVGLLFVLGGFFVKLDWFTNLSQKIDRLLFKEKSHNESKNKWLIDLALILLFLLIALAFFLGRWKGANPVLDLGSDAANVATYAAVLDHPANFASDIAYDSAQNFSFYVSAHIPLIRALSGVLGGYGLAYLSLLLPVIFLQLLGFYFLGKTLFKDRFWALLLSILSLIIVYTESSDYWGIYKDPQPRMLFGAIFPWLLLIVYRGFSNRGFRFLAMTIVGLMLYIHPVSTPAVAFAVWLAFIAIKPPTLNCKRHLIESFAQGLLFVCMAVPFIFIYLNGRDVSSTQVDYATALTAFGSVMSGMFNLSSICLGFLKTLAVTTLLPMAVLALIFSFFRYGKKLEVKMILLWIAGICIVGIGLTTVEAFIDARIHALPVLLDLNRSLRYLIPILEISIFLPLSEVTKRIGADSLKRIFQRSLVYIAGICIFTVLVIGFGNATRDKLDMHQYAQQTVKCWGKGEWYCRESSPQSLIKLLQYISNNTDETASFISIPPINISKVLHYQALRSVVFDPVDINTYLAADLNKYFELQPEKERFKSIGEITDQTAQLAAYLQFAKDRGADYAVVSAEIAGGILPEGYTVVFTSGKYSLVQINP